MKIGLIQHNPTPGDFPRNVRSLIDGYREAAEAGAGVVFTPALALPGTGCRDLLNRSRFALQLKDALAYMATEVGPVPLCVGTLTQNYYGEWEEAYAVLQQGEIVEIISYGDGSEYEPALLEVDGLGVLLLPEGTDCALETNVDLILCPSATPWYLGKEEEDLQEQQLRARELARPLLWCAPAGASDHALYNGQSFALDAEGTLTGRLAAFAEGTLIFDTETMESSEIASPLCDEEALYTALVTALKDYCRKTGLSSLCLGLSGGIDSALAAVIAADAVGAENVLGLTMPSPYSSQGSVDDSLQLAKNLGIRCETIAVTPVFDAVRESLAPLFGNLPEDVTEENMQSRIRGLFLMSAANKFGHMLLSTGNKSEIAVGYCTLYGDTCGGMAPLGDLYKGQVYALSRWINRDGEVIPAATIEKAPSAELRPDQKDQDTLPPYDILDALLKLMVEEELSPSDIIEQYDFDESTVRWVQRRLALNEWKRGQAPLVPQVSRKAFGPGRDMPIVQNFRD